MEPGVTLDINAGFGIMPVPNIFLISNLNPQPWIFGGPTGFRMHIDRNLPLNQMLGNFTYEFISIGTIVIPVLAGTPTAASKFEFTSFTHAATGSAWGSGLNPGVYYPFRDACPNEIHIGVGHHAFFNVPVDHCVGDPPFNLPPTSINDVPGTWSPSSTISTTTPGFFVYTFTPNIPNICEEELYIIVHGAYEIEVDNLDNICGGIPFDLIDAVTVKPTENVADFYFYTFDGMDYTLITNPAGVIINGAGTYDYYVRYIPGDTCASIYEHFTVGIQAPDLPTANVTCAIGVITEIEITHPLGAYDYSIDGINWQTGTTFNTGLGAATCTIYVKDQSNNCLSSYEVTCAPCPDVPDITITNPGSGEICYGTGNYTITGTFVNATAVSVTSDGYGSYNPGSFTTSPMSLTYTPTDTDIGRTVTITFEIPATATCPQVIETVSFDVLATPPPPYVANTYQKFCEYATVGDLVVSGTNVQWYDTPTGGSVLLPTQVLENNKMYYAAQKSTNSCESLSRTAVKVGIVDPTELDAPNVKNQTLCATALVSDIETDGSPGIVFFSGAVELLPTDPVVVGTYTAIYRYGTAPNFCESENITTFIITLITGPAIPPVIANQNFCPGATIADIVVPEGDIVWYFDNTGSPALPTDHELTNHTYYATKNIGGFCGESALVPVVITLLTSVNPPITYEPYLFCTGATLGNINVSGFGVTWYTFDITNSYHIPIPVTTVIPVGVNTYYAGQGGNIICYTDQNMRVKVEVTVLDCNNLLDCDLFDDKTVDEDAFNSCVYTHTGTDWDAVVSSAVPLNIHYLLDGTNIGTTLNGVVFPVGVSTVTIVATYDAFTDECEFTVTVQQICPGTSGPDGDGNPYTVTRVAGLCWTDNLKTKTYVGGAAVEFAKPYYSSMYPDVVAHEATFGLLYTWCSAVNVTEGSTTELPIMVGGFAQGICPNDYHIPSQAEFALLNKHTAEELKSTTHWLEPGNNLSGFNSLPAGKYNASIERFEDLYGFTGYWAHDADAVQKAPYISLTYYTDDCDAITDKTSKFDGLSVRCVWNGKVCPF
jgi:uncharacterized protein (TIGR02145 family)